MCLAILCCIALAVSSPIMRTHVVIILYILITRVGVDYKSPITITITVPIKLSITITITVVIEKAITITITITIIRLRLRLRLQLLVYHGNDSRLLYSMYTYSIIMHD